jgi:sugar phosphate permease
MNPTAVSTPSQPSLFLAWVVCLCAGLFFCYELMQFHLLNAISSVLMQDLKISGSHLGLLGSTYLLADVIFLIPAGLLLDRFSTKKVILIALFVCLLGTVGFAFSRTFFQACLSHFLSGIGNAFCFLSCVILVSRWFSKEKQAFVVGVIVTLGMLGGVLAQAPFNYLAQACSWRTAMLIDASMGAILFAVIAGCVKDAPLSINVPRKPWLSQGFFKELYSCLLNRQNILCGLYTALTNLPLMILGAIWGSLFLTQKHGFSLNESSLIASMICLGTIVGSSLFGYLSDLFRNRKRFMYLGAFASLFMIVLIMQIGHSSSLMMGFLFFALGLFSATQVLGYPLITENAPFHLVGTSMSSAAVIIMGLAGVMQYVSGLLIDLNWNGACVNGAPFYSASDFNLCFMIFPLALILSVVSLPFIKENAKR